jgi:hypothetical protein
VKRSPKDPAALRTLSLFSGKTALEEAELELQGAELLPSEEKTGDPLAMVERQERTAITWLGLDAFHEGDDIRVAVHEKGHAVLMLVRANAGGPYHTATFKLSRHQWDKLKSLAREDK